MEANCLLVRPWVAVIRFLALIGCSIAVVVQLNECTQKLIKPPVTTHTRFHVNNSLWYPALTICREPPFRTEVLQKYGLGASPRYTSEWRNFPWGDVTLEQLYSEATYPAEEVFLLYGLNGATSNVELSSSYFFESGACHTLIPKATTQEAGLSVGYSILVTHSGIVQTTTQDSTGLLGWHVYVHEASETWTESKMQSLGRQEALFVEVGEEVHIKLSVQEFHQTNVGKTRLCVNEIDGGEVRCVERCRWEQMTVDGCGAPWLPGLDLPDCQEYNHTSNLIINYLRYDECHSPCCGCAASCRMVRYEALPITRTPFPATMSQIYVFFNSRLVTLMEERPAYDWSSFLAEMGGSLGFLLGLSVLGLISITEKGVEVVTARLASKKNKDDPVTITSRIGSTGMTSLVGSSISRPRKSSTRRSRRSVQGWFRSEQALQPSSSVV
ncbi:acid-sensing ion channel 2 [Neodiprion virginianus]|uniref:acid-sensing ion channel 2 n=1 Tax=Neodiprion virginianus TaxID=2961670 RepID=UPI001EE77C1A|nr:acid-sensing ion channel 2 [Neodiprion virginianus]